MCGLSGLILVCLSVVTFKDEAGCCVCDLQYWNGVYYAILVYDVTNADSFEACKTWYEELKRAR